MIQQVRESGCQVLDRCLGVLLFVSVLMPTPAASGLESVRADLGLEQAWTGEAVPLIITLYCPGPFSGTAAFDLPELPQTVFVKMGNPTVGSEEIDDESYFTQRHEFRLYTQRSGAIVLPPFRVRFAGKKTFIGDPEPLEGTTAQLQFESRRPPGTEGLGIVVSATSMEFQQAWTPETFQGIQAGDVVSRVVRRTAKGTTSMMLPPVSAGAPEGIQVYPGAPEVMDQVDRGQTQAKRTDTIKYQFQQAGSFTLPELRFVWWDPEQEQLQSLTLAGESIVVTAASTLQQAGYPAPNRQFFWAIAVWGLAGAGLLAWMLREPASRLLARWRDYWNRPEAVAERRLRAACRTHDASAAYAAGMAWLAAQRTQESAGLAGSTSPTTGLDVIGPDVIEPDAFREQWELLARSLFDPENGASSWDGRALWNAFRQRGRRLNRQPREDSGTALPALNPEVASRVRSA